jgi:hypothetical protein
MSITNLQQDELAYWHKKLNGVLSILELPTNYLRSSSQTFQGEL